MVIKEYHNPYYKRYSFIESFQLSSKLVPFLFLLTLSLKSFFIYPYLNTYFLKVIFSFHHLLLNNSLTPYWKMLFYSIILIIESLLGFYYIILCTWLYHIFQDCEHFLHEMTNFWHKRAFYKGEAEMNIFVAMLSATNYSIGYIGLLPVRMKSRYYLLLFAYSFSLY